MNSIEDIEKVGLLLVHGIGDQAKFQYLQTVGDQIVTALAFEFGRHNIAVEMFPGFENRAPLSILVDVGAKQICFDLHEVWWRDLGERPKTSALFKFWLWALSLAGTRGYFEKPSGARRNPDNSSVRWGTILPHDRIKLFAQTTYFFVLLAPLAVVFQLLAVIPGVKRISVVRTIFTYLSSVQMYQERRSRQSGSLTDFDQSRRTSIQRRMANAVLDMADKNYDRWYIVAHSLGSVIAFKALMYDGNAFARLISANRWNHKNFQYRATHTPHGFDYPDEPKQPMWLPSDAAVDLEKVYERLQGLVTYGSPLETFARTWPAIVQINDEAIVSRRFEWLNLHDPVDIVASKLVSYGEANPTGTGEIKPKNVLCRASQLVTHAHTGYLSTKFRNADKKILPALLHWMIDGDSIFDPKNPELGLRILPTTSIAGHQCLAAFQWVLVLIVGCLIWPYSAIAISQVIKSIGSVTLFFSSSAVAAIERWHGELLVFLKELMPGPNYLEDLLMIGKVLGIVSIFLAAFGAIHFAIDWWLDRSDRPKSPSNSRRDQRNGMRAIERPSINIDQPR